MSASIINRAKGTAAFGGGGVILNPSATRLLCFYGGDGGTRGKICTPPGRTATCVPGCAPTPSEVWCDGRAATSSWCNGRPWRGEELGLGMALDEASDHYNEAVVDGVLWNHMLPSSIEAVISSGNDPTAAKLHRAFLSAYGLSEEDVPLVTFRKDRTNCPFDLEHSGPRVHDANVRTDYRVNGVATAWAPRASAHSSADDQSCSTGARGHGGAAAESRPPPSAPFYDDHVDHPALVIG